jgi:hypothetical protein
MLLESQARVLLDLEDLVLRPKIDAFTNEPQQEFKIGRRQYDIKNFNALCPQRNSGHGCQFLLGAEIRAVHDRFQEIQHDQPR